MNTVPLSNKSAYFQAEDGQVIVYTGRYSDPVYYSPNGEQFYELRNIGVKGSTINHTFSFEDPHHHQEGSWTRSGDRLVLDETLFTKVKTPSEIEAIPLPTFRIPEYLFQLPDGQMIYVSVDKYSYGSFRLFLGNGENMRKIPIEVPPSFKTDSAIVRARDGGTTNIYTAKGVLYSPSPYKTDENPIWSTFDQDGKIKSRCILKKLDPKNFNIVESEQSVQITPK